MELKDIIEVIDKEGLKRLILKQDEWIKDLETANESWKKENRKNLELSNDREDTIINLNKKRDDIERNFRHKSEDDHFKLEILKDIAHAINSRSERFKAEDIIESILVSLSNVFDVDQVEQVVSDLDGNLIKQ